MLLLQNQVSSENGSSARESSVPPPTEFDTTNIKASFAPLVQVCCQEKEKFQASENNAFVDNSDKVQASDQVSPTPCYFCKIKMRNNYARNKRFSSNENSCANVTKFKALFGLEQFKGKLIKRLELFAHIIFLNFFNSLKSKSCLKSEFLTFFLFLFYFNYFGLITNNFLMLST